ncbi:unnamed protein product, partial [Polarella glacialis]
MGCSSGKHEQQQQQQQRQEQQERQERQERQEVKTNWYHDFEAKLSKFTSLEGKVFCVTGCTEGIGYAHARAAAQKDAHVVMLNRQSQRSVAAEQMIAKQVPGAK